MPLPHPHLEAVPVPLWLLDADLRVRGANRRARATDPGIPDGASWVDQAIGPDERARVRAELERALGGSDLELTARAADGNRLRLCVAPVEEGLLVCAESDAPETDLDARLLTEHSPSAIATHRLVLDEAGQPVDYVFLSANPAFESQTGLRVADILGKRVTEVLPGIEKTPFLARYGQVALTGEPLHFEQYSPPLDRHYSVSAYRTRPGEFATHFLDITAQKRAEAALAQSEQRLRSYFEHSPVAVFVADPQGRYLEVNPAACRMTGYSAEELCRMQVRDVVAPSSLDAGLAHFREVLETGRAERELGFVTKQGEARWWSVSAVRVSESRLLGFCRDVTERKQAEERVRQSEEDLRSLFESMEDMLFICAPDGRVVQVNAAVERKLGYPPAEVRTRGLLGLHPPDRRAEAEEILSAMLHHRRTTCPLPLQRRDGSLLPVETRVWFGRWSGRDCVFGISKDLTAEQEAQQRFERLFRHNPALMAFSSLPDRRFQDVNDAFLAHLGYRREEVVGRTAAELGLFPDPVEQRSLSRRLETEGRFADVELQVRRRDGVLLDGLFSGELIVSQGRPYFLTVMTDITERKRAAQALQETNRRLEEATAQAARANHAKGEFLANMSHELRTPMNGVLGMTGLLLDSGLTPVQRQYAETVRTSAESLLALLNDILDFSKIEARRLDLEALDFELHDLLEDLCTAQALRAHQKGLELLGSLDPGVPRSVTGDPGRLRQVLANLTGNAVKFTQRGEVVLRVSVQEAGPRPLLRFSVRDTGIGVPAEKVGLLFQKFTQADASTTRKYGGTGLGLAISRELAGLMGGEVGVTTEPGVGSEFWFTARLTARPDRPADDRPLLGRRVLVVDGNGASQSLLVRLLTDWGARAEGVPDLSAAGQPCAAARDGHDPFHLALLDQRLCVAGGRELRALERDFGLATVLLCPLGTPALAGATVASKPVRRRELREGLLAALGGRRHAPAAAPAPRAARFEGCHARILVAEDNITNQQVALGILRNLGLTADAVADGEEALEAHRLAPYDLILMDVQMPRLDGLSATRALREAERRGAPRVAIVAMTAHAMQGDAERCLAAGMDAHLPKPIRPEPLASMLERWLGQRPAPLVFDEAGLLGRMLGDEALARTICEGFLADAPGQLDRLERLAAERDSAGLERQAHTLRSAAAAVGGDAMAAAAEELELRARAREAVPESRLAGLRRGFESLRQEMGTARFFSQERTR